MVTPSPEYQLASLVVKYHAVVNPHSECLIDNLNPCSLSGRPFEHWARGPACPLCAARMLLKNKPAEFESYEEFATYI